MNRSKMDSCLRGAAYIPKHIKEAEVLSKAPQEALFQEGFLLYLAEEE